MKKTIVILTIISVLSLSAVRSSNYKQSVGITVGSYNGFNYKGIFGSNFALDGTLAYGWVGDNNSGLVINVAGLYQADIMKVKGLNWFVGGGVVGGFGNGYVAYYTGDPNTIYTRNPSINYYHINGYMAIHAMGGLEYNFKPTFNVPLILSWAMKPGLGINLTNNYYHSRCFLSWPVNVTLRYMIN